MLGRISCPNHANLSGPQSGQWRQRWPRRWGPEAKRIAQVESQRAKAAFAERLDATASQLREAQAQLHERAVKLAAAQAAQAAALGLQRELPPPGANSTSLSNAKSRSARFCRSPLRPTTTMSPDASIPPGCLPGRDGTPPWTMRPARVRGELPRLRCSLVWRQLQREGFEVAAARSPD